MTTDFRSKKSYAVVSLRECCEEIAHRIDNPSESGYERFVGLEHLETGIITIHRWGKTEDVTSSMKLFKVGDVIVARRNVYLRRIVQADFDGLCSGDGIVLRSNPKICLPDLLPFMLNTEKFWEYVISQADGTMSKRITVKRLLSYKLPLPPLEDQRHIAGILKVIETTINSLMRLKSSVMILRNSLLQENLSHRDGWVQKKLNEVADIVGGGTPSTSNMKYWNGNILWVTPTEVVAANGQVISKTNRKITREGLSSSSAKLLPRGTVLLTTRATIGAAAIAGCELTTNQGFQSLIPGEKTSSKFLLLYCQSNIRQMISRASGSTFLEISSKEVKKFTISLPPLKIQEKIIRRFDQIDSVIHDIDRRRHQLENLKKSVLRSYLRENSS